MHKSQDIWPGQSKTLLQELHILTRDGSLNQDSRRKLKQVLHLAQFIIPDLDDIYQAKSTLQMADLGAGKSYLGLILYDLWLRKHDSSKLITIEARRELVQRSREIAKASAFERVQFIEGIIHDIGDQIKGDIDVVTALHACDTATDEAIAFALHKHAQLIAVVPCCQAEISRWLEKTRVLPELRPLSRHGIHRREFGSHLTNVIRALAIESQGYRIRVTELTGWEHSMKNELIIGRKHQAANSLALKQLQGLLDIYPVPMKLFELFDFGINL